MVATRCRVAAARQRPLCYHSRLALECLVRISAPPSGFSSKRAVVLAALLAVSSVLYLEGDLPEHREPALAHTGSGTPHLEIDADTTNGICTTVDAARTITTGTAFSVAICLSDADTLSIDAVTLSLGYPAALNAPNNIDAESQSTGRDSNPDWNE